MIDYESSNQIYEQNLSWHEKLWKDALKYGRAEASRKSDTPERAYEELYCEELGTKF